jgi:hypothetical protein
MTYRHCCLLVLLGTAPALAQPTLDQVLEKYVQAVGGPSAFEKVTSRVMKGAVEVPDDNTTGTVEVYAKAPDLYRATYNFPGYGIVELVLAGDRGWKKDPDAGVSNMSRNDVTNNQRDHSFYRETRLKDLYPKMEMAGTAQLEGRSVVLVAATPAGGQAEKLYFDAETGLLVKHDFERITLEDGIVQNEVVYRDYRDAGGVKLPYTIEERTPDSTTIVKFSEIQNNVEIGEDRFAKPVK